jgi:hypothetical protein
MTSVAELNKADLVKPTDAKALPQYADYTTALAIHTPATGFKQFAPRDPETQAKYDAMQSTWLGVESSDKAIAAGLYKLDYASDDRSMRPKQTPVMPQPTSPEPKKEEGFCVVQ